MPSVNSNCTQNASVAFGARLLTRTVRPAPFGSRSRSVQSASGTTPTWPPPTSIIPARMTSSGVNVRVCPADSKVRRVSGVQAIRAAKRIQPAVQLD